MILDVSADLKLVLPFWVVCIVSDPVFKIWLVLSILTTIDLRGVFFTEFISKTALAINLDLAARRASAEMPHKSDQRATIVDPLGRQWLAIYREGG